MEIGLKSCYLPTLSDSKFSVHVWIFFPVPQDLWLDCCTAGGNKEVWTKVKSLWEHSECLFCECALCWLNNKKTSSPFILHCNFQLQPNTPNLLKKELYIPQLLHTCAPNVCMKWPTLSLHRTRIHNIFFSVALRFVSMQLTVMFNLKSQPSSSLMERLEYCEIERWRNDLWPELLHGSLRSSTSLRADATEGC